MKAIIKRSAENEQVPYLALDVVVELGDHTKYLDNYLKESGIKEEDVSEQDQSEIIGQIIERAFGAKITNIVEKVVESLDDNSLLEFGMPDVDIVSMPIKFEDLEKSPFQLKLIIPYELIALPMMDSIEKAIENL